MPALATYSDETGMIRLDAFPSHKLNPGPGHHYYLYFSGFRAIESHPFSLAEWGLPFDMLRIDSPQLSSPTEKDQEKESRVEAVQLAADEPKYKADEQRLTFMIKPRRGLTQQLKDKLRKGGSGVPQRLHVLLEGPYGIAANFDKFSNILFIAGGSGITAILPYMHRIADTKRKSANAPMPKARLVWTAKRGGFVRDVLARGLQSTLSSCPSTLEAEYYITEDGVPHQEAVGLGNRADFQPGRPDVEALIQRALSETGDRLAVFLCGPPAMADAVRTLVTALSHQEGNRLELFEELFGW